MSFDFDKEIENIPSLAHAEFAHANILEAEVSTTGLQGGDWGHGSRALVTLKDKGDTAWIVRVNGETFENPSTLEILYGGDSELETFKNAFEFIHRKL